MQPIPEKGPDGTAAKPLSDELSVAHAAETLQRIQSARLAGTEQRPFFLAVGWIRPHLPFRFPERFLQHYDADALELPPTWNQLPTGMPAQAYYKSSETREWKDIVGLGIDYRRYQNGTFLPDDLEGLFLGPVKTRQLRQGYYASISYIDWCVGQLLDEAKKVNGYDDAVVVFMSDHGYQLGEYGLWDKETNFAMATNAPLIIRLPGRTDRGIKSNQLAQGVDVFPTIVAAALNGREVPACPANSSQVATCTQGVSLLPLIYSPHTPVNVAAFSVHPSYWKPDSETPPVTNERFDRFEGHQEATLLDKDPRSPCLGSKRLKLGDEAKHPTKYESTCIMGSSMLYLHDRHELRYTEWSGFAGPESNWRPNWDDNFAVELYNHSTDPSESRNMADCTGLAPEACRRWLTKRHPELYKLLRGVLHNQVASVKARKLLDQSQQRETSQSSSSDTKKTREEEAEAERKEEEATQKEERQTKNKEQQKAKRKGHREKKRREEEKKQAEEMRKEEEEEEERQEEETRMEETRTPEKDAGAVETRESAARKKARKKAKVSETLTVPKGTPPMRDREQRRAERRAQWVQSRAQWVHGPADAARALQF